MALAEILDSNPQEFIMEAYADPLKYYAPDPPNDTNPAEALVRILIKIGIEDKIRRPKYFFFQIVNNMQETLVIYF
jgi:hypothetical protein